MKGETAALDYKSVERTIDVLADTVAVLLEHSEVGASDAARDHEHPLYTVVFPEVPAIEPGEGVAA